MLEVLIKREINGSGLSNLCTVVEKMEELTSIVKEFYSDKIDKKLYDELVDRLKSEKKSVKMEIWEKSSKRKRK